MDAIDYTPPTKQEREFLDWAMAKHKEKLNNSTPAIYRKDRDAPFVHVGPLADLQDVCK